MPEDQNTEPADQAPDTPKPTPPPAEYRPPATQEDLDRIVEARLNRERAKYADYDDLKAKATQWDQAEEANKSELEKATARAEQAEADLATLRQSTLRLEVANAKGIPADLAGRLTGSTREELEADADQLLTHLAPTPPRTRPVAAQNGADKPPATDFLRAALERRYT